MLLYEIIERLDSNLHFERVSAHCDIPCKIYDPISAQLAVLTMIRMVELLEDLEQKAPLSLSQQAQFQRLVAEKESHGKKVKEEIRVIWGDYFKSPQIEAYPEIHELTHSIMLATSFAKQHIDMDASMDLLAKVNRFAEIFWQSKGVETHVATCPYPPSKALVYPKLG